MSINDTNLVVSMKEMVQERLDKDLQGFASRFKENFVDSPGTFSLVAGCVFLTIFCSFLQVNQPIPIGWPLVFISLLGSVLTGQSFVTGPLLAHIKQKKELVAEETKRIGSEGLYGLALVKRARGILAERVKRGQAEIESTRSKVSQSKALLTEAEGLLSGASTEQAGAIHGRAKVELEDILGKFAALDKRVEGLKKVETKLSGALDNMEAQAKLLRASELVAEASGSAATDSSLTLEFENQILELSQMCEMVKQIGVASGQDVDEIAGQMLQLEESTRGL